MGGDFKIACESISNSCDVPGMIHGHSGSLLDGQSWGCSGRAENSDSADLAWFMSPDWLS